MRGKERDNLHKTGVTLYTYMPGCDRSFLAHLDCYGSITGVTRPHKYEILYRFRVLAFINATLIALGRRGGLRSGGRLDRVSSGY